MFQNWLGSSELWTGLTEVVIASCSVFRGVWSAGSRKTFCIWLQQKWCKQDLEDVFKYVCEARPGGKCPQSLQPGGYGIIWLEPMSLRPAWVTWQGLISKAERGTERLFFKCLRGLKLNRAAYHLKRKRLLWSLCFVILDHKEQ